MRSSVLVLAGASLVACSAGSVVMLAGAPEGAAEAPKLSGVYKATVLAPMLGPVEARLTAEPTETGFKANTRPGVAWNMIGGLEGALGQVFAPFLFPGGVILTWESAAPARGQVAEGWISAGSFKNARMLTRMKAADAPIELYSKEGKRVGTITLEPARADDPPFGDYPKLAEGVAAAIASRMYDPAVAKSSQIRAYLRHLRGIAATASDDVEFIFGNGAAAHRHLKMSWPIVAKKEDPAAGSLSADDADMGTIEVLFDEETRIATVEVKAFLSPGEIDRIFDRIHQLDPVGVKFDLLKCPGVTMSALYLASYIVSEPTLVGAFYDAAHREAAKAGEVGDFPTVTIDSAPSVKVAEAALDLHGAINLVVHPVANRYTGPVAVLTTEKTATSAEPLVWVLKNSTRATVHGMTTSGNPQLSRPIDLGQGWVVWIATADYRPPTGERIDRGIEPHFPTRRRGDAKKNADKRLIVEAAKQKPTPAQSPRVSRQN